MPQIFATLRLIAVDLLLQFFSLESDANKCYVLLCWKIFQSTSRSMYGLTTEQDTFPGFRSLCHEVLRVLPRTQVTCLLGGEFF